MLSDYKKQQEVEVSGDGSSASLGLAAICFRKVIKLDIFSQAGNPINIELWAFETEIPVAIQKPEEVSALLRYNDYNSRI